MTLVTAAIVGPAQRKRGMAELTLGPSAVGRAMTTFTRRRESRGDMVRIASSVIGGLMATDANTRRTSEHVVAMT